MSSDDKTNRPGQEERTVFQPGGGPAPSAPPERTSSGFVHNAPRADARIQVGDVLNHIFEVRRFIARGGMGEVFEGVNISSDERVAIKVMLPALTADPNVQAMFRKEARTLTRLNHPALVTYRVLAQEPNLGLLYIVTEFIEGPSLCDVLGQLSPGAEQLRQLGIRLADGLRVAHDLGAIHRDISPDNILLADGQLERATIIDFGIAKDLDPSSKTIVGDGFAGKLNYVAPEQLGDFGRDVGPWSDIYSLGLVLLAAASGRNVDMGATLVDAVDRRRAGPDLSPLPDALRPVLERMLKPNPAERFRSMAEVSAAFANQQTVFEPAAAAAPPAAPSPEAVGGPDVDAPATGKSRTPLLLGAAAAALLALGAGGYFLLGGGDTAPAPAPSPTSSATSKPGSIAAADPRAALNQALAAVPCSWLDIVDMRASGQTSVALKGVTQSPASAQAAIASALQASGAPAANISFDQVTSIPASMCSVLDAFRSIRMESGTAVSVTQPKWELIPDEAGSRYARVEIEVDLGPQGQGVAFFGLQENGTVEPVTAAQGPVASRAAMMDFLKANSSEVKQLSDNRYRLSLYPDQQGWQGFLMVTGREPFDVSLIATPSNRRDPAWQRRFLEAARRGGWKAQMAWFKVVDEVQEAGAPAL